MANIYYGCLDTTGLGNPPVLDGNWNTVGNWYLTLGTGPSCCCTVPGTPATPAGRVPAPGDTVMMYGNATVAAHNNITTGPANWAGPVDWAGSECLLEAGTFSGTITIDLPNAPGSGVSVGINGGTYTGTIDIPYVNSMGVGSGNTGIFSGTFSSASTVSLTGAGSTPTGKVGIFGGTFQGTVTRSGTTNIISGGTYEPAWNPAFVSPNSLNVSTIPTDPGFAQGGGTFAPRVTISGLPDILGAGMPIY